MPEIPAPNAEPTERLGVLPAHGSLYFNGFEMAVTSADIIMTLKLNNQRLVTCNYSFTTAKTLLDALRGTIEVLEKATKHPIMSIHEVKAAESKMGEMMKVRREAKLPHGKKPDKKRKNGGQPK